MSLPETKDELETVLLNLWAMPVYWDEAYRLYALDEKRKLAAFLNWLSDRSDEISPETLEEEDTCVDENGNWIDRDDGGLDLYD